MSSNEVFPAAASTNVDEQGRELEEANTALAPANDKE
jgi:hypothetical protein